LPNNTTTDPRVSPGPTQTSRRVRRSLVLLRWGSLIAPLVLFAAFAVTAWNRLETEAMREASRRSELIVEYVRRTVEGQELLLTAADEAHGRLSFGSDIEGRMHRFLAALTGASGWDSVSLIGPDGATMLSSESYPVSGRFATPEYVAGISRSGLFIDRLNLGRTKLLILALRDDDAPEPGIWLAKVDVAPIEDFLRNIAGGSGRDAASVMRADGRVLLRNLPMADDLQLTADTMVMRKIATSDVASYETVSAIDGVDRIYSTRRVGDLPLYANFGMAVGGIRAAWLRQVMLAAGLLGSFGAIGYGVARHAARALETETARAAHDFDRKLLVEAQKTAASRETMLRELNHRINNNLQMIQSLIRLQKTREAGPDLDEISARILAIARIHDLLYQSGSSFHVDLAALLQSVASNSALVPPERGIAVECELERVEADARVATPLALCVTELVTNAVKHAFGPEGGTIAIGLRAIDGGAAAEVMVSDDGRGLPQTSGRSSGARLIAALVVQIGGSLEMTPLREDAERPGARARIVFPLAVKEA
jgi:two-component sensor histidine kinase